MVQHTWLLLLSTSLLMHVSSTVVSMDSVGEPVRNCSKDGKPLGPYPQTVKNTTQELIEIRKYMGDTGVDGYYIPLADDHQTEYTAEWFKRIKYISGFSGSWGHAIVTLTGAYVWADGRYHVQVDTQVDCNWKPMKYGQAGVLSPKDWIATNLAGKKLGVDPKVLTIDQYESFKAAFDPKSITIVKLADNLVDKVWSDQRPKDPKKKLFVQELKYSGVNFTSKINDLRSVLKTKDCGSIVVQLLDDVAWLLNLRGLDVPYVPFFYGYVLVTMTKVVLYVDADKLKNNGNVTDHLCPHQFQQKQLVCVDIKDYDYAEIKKDIDMLVKQDNKKIWITKRSNFAIADMVDQRRRYIAYSPVQLPKAIKNQVEIDGMKIANIRDGVGIMESFLWLQKELDAGKTQTEVSYSEQLIKIKAKQKEFLGLSFHTIAGFGSNGAIIHYSANRQTDKQITKDNLFLVDCGAQFPGGSTDITRTMHFGEPTEKMKKMYTLVMKGSIGLASAVFVEGTYGYQIEHHARQPLNERGLNYNHGTGHGIGSYLSIHEGPGSIGTRYAPYHEWMRIGFVFSDEPGYYETGEFGIRLETDMIVTEANTTYHFGSKKYLTFEMLTLVPFQKKMIVESLLTDKEIDWLNAYNLRIRDVMGKEIQDQMKSRPELNELYDHMRQQTVPIDKDKPVKPTNAADGGHQNNLVHVMLATFASVMMAMKL